MDPNETLAELRELLTGWSNAKGAELPDVAARYAEHAADAAQRLDEWLSKGGFLPEEWRLAPPEEHSENKPQLKVQDWMRRAHEQLD